MPPVPVALVGIGKIARDQHIPAIAANPDLVLAAAVSRHETVEGVPNFQTLEAFLRDGPDAAVALCVPPRVRTAMAVQALAAGRDVLLEKPPAATTGEVEVLLSAAAAGGGVLFATWHSRFAPAVAAAKAWIAEREVVSAAIVWREDVRRWHPGQAWIWEAGGFGVFDPGINALSILTEILPGPFLVADATLTFPANRAMPIAATLGLTGRGGFPVAADFDWRQEGRQTWEITVETTTGKLTLVDGAAALHLDGVEVSRSAEQEYPAIYRRFAGLIRTRTSDVDASPLRICADAFLLGTRILTDAFHD